MSIRIWRAGLPGLAIMLVPFGPGVAHEIVGNRFFPATLGIDDPGVNDELSFPTFDTFKTGDDPASAPRADHILQLALYGAALAPLYPDRIIKAYLVWIEAGRLTRLSPAALDRALADLRDST